MSENKKLIPKRRFKEFENAYAWEECELGEVVFVNSGRDYKHLSVGNIPVYGTGGYMLSVNNKLSDEDAVGIGRKGSIDNPQYLRAPFWTVDTLFFLTPKEEMNLRFFYAMAQGIKWRQFDESTGVPSLSKVNIEKITKNFPKIEEQEIIGQFFRNLDQTIAFQQRKLEKMKSMKSAYLSEMFPAAGERKPKRRFPGFTDDWKQCELIKVANYRNGKAHEQDISDDGPYVVVNSKFISTDGTVRKFASKQSEPLLKDEIAFVLSDVPNGKAIARTYLVPESGKYTLNQRIAGITPNSETYAYFLYILMNRNKYFLAFDTGVGQTNLSRVQVEQFEGFYPSFEEQEKIGNFFKNLDRTLAFQQQKLEKLQNIKKAYLNEMFI